MSLPSQADFVANHVHECQAPNECRCSICLDDLSNGQRVVRIELNHGNNSCHYHNDCIQAWFTNVGQQRWTCPDHRIELFEPAPVVLPLGSTGTQDDPAAIREHWIRQYAEGLDAAVNAAVIPPDTYIQLSREIDLLQGIIDRYADGFPALDMFNDPEYIVTPEVEHLVTFARDMEVFLRDLTAHFLNRVENTAREQLRDVDRILANARSGNYREHGSPAIRSLFGRNLDIHETGTRFLHTQLERFRVGNLGRTRYEFLSLATNVHGLRRWYHSNLGAN